MAKEGLFVSILDMLRRVPRRMLMVLKINDLTRSLDYNLHTTHGAARPFIIAARYCALAVWDDDRENLRRRRKEQGWSVGLVSDWLGAWWKYFVSFCLTVISGLWTAGAHKSANILQPDEISTSTGVCRSWKREC